jgi:putative DNA primase/helicase
MRRNREPKPEERQRASVAQITEAAKQMTELSTLRYGEIRESAAMSLGLHVGELDGEVNRQRQRLESEASYQDRITCTDAGNADRFVERNSNVLRFCRQRSKAGWFWWNGNYWQPDALGKAVELARLTAVEIAAKATQDYKRQIINDDKYKSELAWSMTSLSDKLLTAMLRQAGAGTELCVTGDAFDSNISLLNVRNGTINLDSGSFHAARREDMITQIAGVRYDPGARCPKWEDFISVSLQGHTELIEYVRRASGYFLTGSEREQCFFLIQGAPGTGKSTFWRLMMYLLGDYFVMVPSGLFVKKGVFNQADGDAATPGLVKLVGKRVAAEVELGESDKFASTLLKRITGGEALTCRPLYAEHFTFQPQCKPVFLTNHQPGTSDFSGGLQDRLRIIKFDHIVRGTPQENKNLVDELREEGPGILNWCLAGLAEYKKFNGLREPVVVKTNVEKYFEEENVVARFLKERATPNKVSGTTIPAGFESGYATFSQMYKTFKDWCESNEETYGSSKWFQIRMKQLGHETTPDRVNTKYYQFKLNFPRTGLDGTKPAAKN